MSTNRAFQSLVLIVWIAACGKTDATSDVPDGGGDGGPSVNGGGRFGVDNRNEGVDAGDKEPVPTIPMYPELWYSVDQWLIRVELNADGTIKEFQSSTITTQLDSGHSAITMLKDGSLLIARLSEDDSQSHFFYVAKPPRDSADVTPTSLGVMPDGIMIEGLYTDCEGRLYAMDTGANAADATGNRLLRFTKDVTAGDYTFVQVSDLSSVGVADIDDMGPGINSVNKIVDNPGFAIDTGRIYKLNFETGKSSEVGNAGSFGIHALGGSLFSDGRSRLYVMSEAAEIIELNPTSYTSSGVLGRGPKAERGFWGWSGLTGPLTDCAASGFVTQPK